jgi:hypothetical protein
MQSSTQVITDLHTLASASFTRESIEKASDKLREESLSMLIGVAVARAAELKDALMKIERVIDPADPQYALLSSVLSILN